MYCLKSVGALPTYWVAAQTRLNGGIPARIVVLGMVNNFHTESAVFTAMWVRQKTITDSYKFTHLSHHCNSLNNPSIDIYSKGPSIRQTPNKRKVHHSTLQAAKMAGQSGQSEGKADIFCYKLSESCKLVLQPGDITKWYIDGETDAIVNAANECMLGGGGVDGAIHRAAGPELFRACSAVPEVEPGVRCPTGSARITKAFKLPVSHVIHTVGPVYESEGDSASALSSAYKTSVMVAKENHIKYVAFPAISCGVYGYPIEEAAEVALSTLQNHAADLEEVHFVLFDRACWKAWLEKANRLFEKQEKCGEQ